MFNIKYFDSNGNKTHDVNLPTPTSETELYKKIMYKEILERAQQCESEFPYPVRSSTNRKWKAKHMLWYSWILQYTYDTLNLDLWNAHTECSFMHITINNKNDFGTGFKAIYKTCKKQAVADHKMSEAAWWYMPHEFTYFTHELII